MVSLYGGTSSSSLSLITTVLLNNPSASAGQIPSTQLILPNIPGGQTAWFQLRIWSDPAYASYEAALAAGGPIYFGESPEFSMIPGSNVTYPSPINSPGTTWVEAPLYIGLVPEPSVLRLAGLAGSLVWLFRRARKQRCGSNSCGSEQGFLTAL